MKFLYRGERSDCGQTKGYNELELGTEPVGGHRLPRLFPVYPGAEPVGCSSRGGRPDIEHESAAANQDLDDCGAPGNKNTTRKPELWRGGRGPPSSHYRSASPIGMLASFLSYVKARNHFLHLFIYILMVNSTICIRIRTRG